MTIWEIRLKLPKIPKREEAFLPENDEILQTFNDSLKTLHEAYEQGLINNEEFLKGTFEVLISYLNYLTNNVSLDKKNLLLRLCDCALSVEKAITPAGCNVGNLTGVVEKFRQLSGIEDKKKLKRLIVCLSELIFKLQSP